MRPFKTWLFLSAVLLVLVSSAGSIGDEDGSTSGDEILATDHYVADGTVLTGPRPVVDPRKGTAKPGMFSSLMGLFSSNGSDKEVVPELDPVLSATTDDSTEDSTTIKDSTTTTTSTTIDKKSSDTFGFILLLSGVAVVLVLLLALLVKWMQGRMKKEEDYF